MTAGALLNQLNLVVRDVAASVAFYRLAGLPIDAEPAAFHVAVHFPNGFLLELDSTGFVGEWDTGWPGGVGGNAVIGLAVDSRDEVDHRYRALTGAGHRGRQPPYDAFWGARYAIVEDPDGYPVGLMSPIDPVRKFWPPSPPPRGSPTAATGG